MPEVICNTSPLQYLHQIGQLNILPALAGSIIVPPAVLVELDAGIAIGLDLPQPQNLKWVKIQAPYLIITWPRVTTNSVMIIHPNMSSTITA